ncbi:phytanoyl-CoA dioxygenase family protein [Breoghania sp.]|uniref:phytanoyl-CoA dioxygenase family protein n=1 Tax=Breoghania sp. TaxID=2065378 RepID=UPI0026114795|nr:phytanoyl-CoA dioxygenase family protein [Breoghania sp.]MDJ0931168.1 phytanoyl-CoA dioxygenase family protein [Breoghania sp.]
MKAIDILRVPVWALELASGAKSFCDNPLIDSPGLNRRRLHVARVRLAERMVDWRRRRLAHLVEPRDVEDYARDGFVIRRNALPEADFQALRRAVEENAFPAQEMWQGNAVTRFAPATCAMCADHPEIGSFVNGALFQGLLRYVASTDANPIVFLHTIFAEPDRGPRDPQTVFHSDTFHATAKAWFFLEDVAEDGGPFTYVPGSHRMTPERLRWEYEKSLIAREDRNWHHALGSFRISDQELEELGYGASVSVAVPANTLVVADTHGFHAGGVSRRATVRLGVYGSLRRNPFLSFTGARPVFVAGP